MTATKKLQKAFGGPPNCTVYITLERAALFKTLRTTGVGSYFITSVQNCSRILPQLQ